MSTTITEQSVLPQPSLNTVLYESSAVPNPQEVVIAASLGYVTSACLQVTAKLHIADLIGNGVCDLAALSQQAGVDADYLFRVLRVLEMNQLVSRTTPTSFELTPAGELLRSDTSGSLAGAVEWITDPLHFDLYSELHWSVKTGTTTFDSIHGQPFFQWLSLPQNSAEARIFNNAMTSFSKLCVPAFLEAYDFGTFKKIIDIGGGHGALLRAILREYSKVEGVIAEMPAVVPDAKMAIEQDGLAGRCDAVECDFFSSVPAGGDAYLMKHIVHDWADAQALQLLRNIRAVVPQHGKLILAEIVLDDAPTPHPGKLLDIEMMTFVGGKERTKGQFRQLLHDAGFSLVKVIPTKSPLSLLEATPF